MEMADYSTEDLTDEFDRLGFFVGRNCDAVLRALEAAQHLYDSAEVASSAAEEMPEWASAACDLLSSAQSTLGAIESHLNVHNAFAITTSGRACAFADNAADDAKEALEKARETEEAVLTDIKVTDDLRQSMLEVAGEGYGLLPRMIDPTRGEIHRLGTIVLGLLPENERYI